MAKTRSFTPPSGGARLQLNIILGVVFLVGGIALAVWGYTHLLVASQGDALTRAPDFTLNSRA